MLEILEWCIAGAVMVPLSIYVCISVIGWFLFWEGGMFCNDVDGFFTEGWESFKLAFSWPAWLIQTAWYMRNDG